MRSVETILDRLDGVRRNQAGWTALCPAHDDRRSSLSIRNSDDGKVLLKCFAGCETDNILLAIGLRMADLFPKTGKRGQHREIIAAYDYCDANGMLIFQTVRVAPKDFRQRRPGGNGRWIWNLGGIEPVLYQLPELLEAIRTGRTICIVEGEKDVEGLRKLGLVATCSPMGAGKWRQNYTRTLCDAHVVIFPDNDTPGRKHALQVAQALHGVAASIRIADLPDLPEKGDVSDWLDAGHGKDDLLRLIEQAPAWKPLSGTVWEKAITSQALVDMALPNPQGLLQGIVYPGRITILAAPRGSGKSQAATALTGALAQGTMLCGRTISRPVRVCYVDADNPPQETQNRIRGFWQDSPPEFVIYTRDTDPPGLLDYTAWEAFPTDKYDVLVLDSFGSLTPGVSEAEGSKYQRAVQTLVMLANRGLAVIVLDNTNQAASNIRGRGEKSDRVDLVYEVRECTGWTPKQGKAWWTDLPPADAASWSERAERLDDSDGRTLRMAFIATKTRGLPPQEPFVWEIDFSTEPWQARDVTLDVKAAGDAAVKQRLQDERRAMEDAALALRRHIIDSDEPTAKRAAEDFLSGKGLTHRQPRNIIEHGFHGRYWILETQFHRPGKPAVLLPLSLINPRQLARTWDGILLPDGFTLERESSSVPNNAQSEIRANTSDDNNPFGTPLIQADVPNRLAEIRTNTGDVSTDYLGHENNHTQGDKEFLDREVEDL